LHRNRGTPASLPGAQDFSGGGVPTKPFSGPAQSFRNNRWIVINQQAFWRRIMQNDDNRSEGWDPALWSIGTALSAAILYLACLA
jgi:hypothetical protein